MGGTCQCCMTHHLYVTESDLGHIFDDLDSASSHGPNFMALLTVSKDSALTQARKDKRMSWVNENARN